MQHHQITPWGKALGGVLLVLFTLLPLALLIGLWPNQMPTEKTSSYYKAQLFDMRVISLPPPQTGNPANEPSFEPPPGSVHINTILFLLVALGGFMGSMIHMATSFTNHVGSRTFRSDWILWYCVKPFTAAGVAVVFFLVLNAGLLNFGSSGSVNPFGIVILAAMAGLFTDKATLKLEEIFTVIFKPKDGRPDSMEAAFSVAVSSPRVLHQVKENTVQLSGKGFDRQIFSITMNGQEITNPVISSGTITFPFNLNPEDEKTEVHLQVTDEKNKVLFEEKIPVAPLTEEEKLQLNGSTTTISDETAGRGSR